MDLLFRVTGVLIIVMFLRVLVIAPFHVGKEREPLSEMEVVTMQVGGMLFVLWFVFALYRGW